MKAMISRRSFLKAAGITAAAAGMTLGAPAASACWPFEEKAAVTILHTNDVHTYIDKQAPELTYAAIAALKKSYQDAGQDVLLVDAGDHIQGTAYGAMDKGASIVKLMNAAGYDVATVGNHEFDYGMDRIREIISNEAEYQYICCNWISTEYIPMRVLPDIKLCFAGGMRIAFVGIATPSSITSSTPAYFMDESKSRYIYDILGGEDGKKLYDAVQYSINKARLVADYVIGLGHLGVEESSKPWRSEDVIANTTGFDAFIDGHSHTVMQKKVADASGKEIPLTQTGCYFEYVGKMTINTDGTISTELIPTYDGVDSEVDSIQQGWINSVEDMLGEKIAVADMPLYINDPATGLRRVRSAETNMGDFISDAIYAYFNEIEQVDCDIAIMNGGGIRSDEPAGDWSFKTCKQVSPFGNVACLISVKGKQIQDALEFGARFAGSGRENGGFLHVAGASYEIHTDLPNTVPTDEKNVWLGSATGTPRVQNVKIYNKKTGVYEPLDPERSYSMAGMNYTLRSYGDGFAMFEGAELINDYVSEDYLVSASYAMLFGGVDANGFPHISTANSPLAQYPGYLINYEEPYGAGRITIF